GAAAGSIASQAVGIAIGQQDSFSWKSVAQAALTGAIGGALSTVGGAAKLLNVTDSLGSQVVNAVANNVVSQGASIALGLQDKFNWSSVAASAVAAPLAAKIGGKVGAYVGSNTGSAFAAQVAGGLAAGAVNQVAYAAFTGGKINYAQIVADAFGNA